MNGVVADTSLWIDLLAGRPARALEDALRHGIVVVPPLVVAELISGARGPRDRASIEELVRALPLHETPLEHWMRVGNLRRRLAGRGLAVSTADAHVAQCAIDRGALLLSRDAIFARIAAASGLRVHSG